MLRSGCHIWALPCPSSGSGSRDHGRRQIPAGTRGSTRRAPAPRRPCRDAPAASQRGSKGRPYQDAQKLHLCKRPRTSTEKTEQSHRRTSIPEQSEAAAKGVPSQYPRQLVNDRSRPWSLQGDSGRRGCQSAESASSPHPATGTKGKSDVEDRVELEVC